jgi:hypothetical protein
MIGKIGEYHAYAQLADYGGAGTSPDPELIVEHNAPGASATTTRYFLPDQLSSRPL